jgi:hypothetical protein
MRFLPFATVALALAAAPAPARADVTATLTPATAFAAGNRQIGAGPGTTRQYTVTSTGTDALTVQSIGFTGADAAQFTVTGGTCAAGTVLASGQTCTVIAAFAPAATGARATTLAIGTSGPALVSAAITGTGRDLGVSAGTLNFSGRVGAGAAAKTVTLTNRDTADYALGAISVSAQFVKTQDACGSTTLAAGASCTVSVAFAPTSPGPKSGSLSLASHGPALVAVAGDALQPASAISPATHTFSDAPQTFTLRSTGAGPVSIGQAAVSGAYSITADTCSGQVIGGTCTVTVKREGSARGALTIPTDGGTAVARLEAPGGAGFNLSALPLARLQGDGGDGAGGALAGGPCDVDGDGYDDVITGASQWSRFPAANSWEGAAYVTFGGPDFGGRDLAGLHDSIRLEGSTEGAFAGTGVGCADVDGDGLDDILVGAWAYEYPGRPSGIAASRGRAYVVFGSKDLRDQATLDLGALGARGYTIAGPNEPEYDHLGYQVIGVGDLNGDGREEIAVMANTGDTTDASPARSNNGIVWVVPGQAGTAQVDLSQAGSVLARIDGASPGTSAAPFGQMIGLARLGDVNGDGAGDIGIGTYTATAFGRSTASGAAFAISGKTRGRVDLAKPESYLFAVGGAFAGHRLGIAIDGAGDVDGDGIGDIVIGADSTAAANSDAAYVVYGERSRSRPAGTLLDSAALGGNGYRIRGATGSTAGFAVAGAGDANGDGLDDVAVGGYGFGPNGSGWIVYGVKDPAELALDTGLVPANAADTTRTIALDALGARGVRIDGQTAGERFGRAVAAVGDPDGNGATDVAFGSDFAYRFGRLEAGEVAVALLPGAAKTPAPAPTPTPAPVPQAAPAPKPRNTAVPALAVRTVRVDTRGRVALKVVCARIAARCAGSLELRFGGRTIAKAPLDLDGAKTVRLSLPAKLRKRTLHAAAILAVTAAGHEGEVRRTLKLTIRGRR